VQEEISRAGNNSDIQNFIQNIFGNILNNCLTGIVGIPEEMPAGKFIPD
jgi:hypothetical protein